MSFLGELRRRNVLKVGASYAIVAWLLIQAATVILPTFDAPRWAVQTVTFLLIVGFPAALVLAWAYEITPEGIKRASEVALDDRRVAGAGQMLNYLVIGLLVIAVTFLAIDNYVLPERETAWDRVAATGGIPGWPSDATSASRTVTRNSIAVLPFENLSPNVNDTYFAAGIHEEVLNQLAKISDLNVIARTTMVRYAGRPIEEIARELNAQAVMEGTVRYGGDRVRITAQLIAPETGGHLWSETYDRAFRVENIFAIESDIATNIAAALKAQLLPAESSRIARVPTQSQEAYTLYLRALTIYRETGSFNVTTPPTVRASLQEQLDRALELDPEFAAAHALKAWIYFDSLHFDPVPRESWVEGMTRIAALAHRHVDRALELDASLGLAHAGLGRLEIHAWRLSEAAAAFELARELNPNDAEVWQWSGYLEWFRGRPDDAVRNAERARSLDPENPASYVPLYFGHHAARNFGEASVAARRYIELAPAASLGYLQLARTQFAVGNEPEAREALQIAGRLMTQEVAHGVLADRAYGHKMLEEPDEARRLFAVIEAAAATVHLSSSVHAWALLAVGDYEQARAKLELAIRERAEIGLGVDPFPMTFIRENVWSDPMLEQPEFLELRRRLGYAP